MNTGIRIKSLNGDTYTETVIKDGKTFINVYGLDGQLVDVMAFFEIAQISSQPRRCDFLDAIGTVFQGACSGHCLGLNLDHRVFPLPVVQCFRNCFHANAFHGAGREAKFATRTLLADDGVHLFGSANNRVDRAGLNTEGAANAGVFIDDGNLLGFFYRIERLDFLAQQVGKPLHPLHATGGAEVDIAFAFCDGFCVRLAPWVTALPTLCLRENRLDFFDQRIAFNLELD